MSDPEESDGSNNMFPTPGHRLEFIAKVRLLGIKTIDVGFSGSGDSGTVEDPVFFGDNGVDISETAGSAILAWPSEESQWNQRTMSWDKVTHEAEDTPLRVVVDSMCNKALEGTALDWYNNDGGQGHFVFTFPPEGMAVALSVGINYTETTEHSFEF